VVGKPIIEIPSKTDAEKLSYLGARLPAPPSNLTRGPSVPKLPAAVSKFFKLKTIIKSILLENRADRLQERSLHATCEEPRRMWQLLGSHCHRSGRIWQMQEERRKCHRPQVDRFNQIEMLEIKIKPDLINSEQQIVECSTGAGCSGGWEHDAWKYLASCGGHAAESSYPYTERDGACRFSPTGMAIGAKLSTSNPVEWVPMKDTATMMDILSTGRILTIYIHLPDSFFNYK